MIQKRGIRGSESYSVTSACRSIVDRLDNVLQRRHVPKRNFVLGYCVWLQSQVFLALDNECQLNSLAIRVRHSRYTCRRNLLLDTRRQQQAALVLKLHIRLQSMIQPCKSQHDHIPQQTQTEIRQVKKTHSRCASVTDAGGRLCPTLSHFKTFFEADVPRLG
jgi:hypothetical protein